MKPIKLKFIFAILCVSAISMGSCGNNENEDISSDGGTLHIGDITVFKINESVSFFHNIEAAENDSVTISFKEVVSDNRVPISLCYLSYGSRADIEIALLHQNDTCNIPFIVWGCNTDGNNNLIDDLANYKDTLDYRIHIFRLSPYPNEPIESSDYEIKLQVTKL
jgi:hypothetical protein